jgi:hypothetical protein
MPGPNARGGAGPPPKQLTECALWELSLRERTAIGSGIAARLIRRARFAGPATGLPLGHRPLGEKEVGGRDAGGLADAVDHLAAEPLPPLPEQVGVLPGNPDLLGQVTGPGDAMLSEQLA